MMLVQQERWLHIATTGQAEKAERRQLAPSNRLPTAKPLLSHSHWVPLYEVRSTEYSVPCCLMKCLCSICIPGVSRAECLTNMVVVAVRPCCRVQKYKLQLVPLFPLDLTKASNEHLCSVSMLPVTGWIFGIHCRLLSFFRKSDSMSRLIEYE
jgi:hypothetical protein